MVYVNAGDSKGQQGKVLRVDAAKQRAVVEGVNMSKKATKPNAQNPQGGIIASFISCLFSLICTCHFALPIIRPVVLALDFLATKESFISYCVDNFPQH